MGLNQLVAGAQTGSPGGYVNQRGTTDGAAAVADAHGRYAAAVAAGRVYTGANLAGTPVTTQAGLSVTTPALTLFNPSGSGLVASLLAVGISVAAAPAAASQFLLARNLASAAAPTLTTIADVTCNLLGPLNTPACQCARVATLAAAPLGCFNLGGTTGAAAISGVPLWFDLGGIIAIGPGVALSFQTIGAASVCVTFIWEEIPSTFQ